MTIKTNKTKQDKRLLSSIMLVFTVTALAKALGMVREILQARVFGAGEHTDLYSLANNATVYLFTTAAYALCVAAVPLITGSLQKSREEGLKTAGNIISVSLLCSVPALGIWALIANGTFMRILLPTLPVIVVAYLLVALLQSLDHYEVQGLLSFPYNLALCAFLLIFGDKFGMAGYVAVVSIAWLLQLGTTLPYVIKERIWLSFKPDFKAPYLASYFKSAIVIIITTAVYLFCYMLDAAFARGMGEGAVSSLYYADRLFTPIVTSLIYSISAVVYPKFGQMNSVFPGGGAEYKEYIASVLDLSLRLMLPVTAIFTVLSRDMVNVLYLGGNFSEPAAVETGLVLTMLGLGTCGIFLLDLINKAYYAMGKIATPLVVCISVLILNLALNAAARYSWALAAFTSFALVLGGLGIAFFFFRGTKIFSNHRRVYKWIIASAAAGGALFAARLFISTDGAAASYVILICGILGLGACALYDFLCFLMHEEPLMGILIKKLKRK